MAQPILQQAQDLLDDLSEEYYAVREHPTPDENALQQKTSALKDIRNRIDGAGTRLIDLYSRIGSIFEKKRVISVRDGLLLGISFELQLNNETLVKLKS